MQLDFDLKGTLSKPKPAPKPAEPVVLTVSALTRKVRSLLEDGIGEVWVEGEISNLRRQSSGHAYFTLKDAGSQIACVLFAGQTAQLRGMNFADGVHVQLQGSLTVYEPRGNYQIIVRRIQERGVGALQAKFEELKRRLDAEGLFDSSKKRPLPKFPRRIGVVTSPTGAAIQDFLNVLHRRQRGIEVVIFPVRVQGKGAAAEIAEAIRLLGDPSATSLPPFDVLVVTRGGGSLEDLWEFNEEAVARAVAASPVPVVSAVGHEIDFTICDFAADFRAPTPSAAAEILSADSAELLDKLQHLTARLGRPVQARLEGIQNQLLALQRTALFLEPRRVLQERQQTLDRWLDDLQSVAESTPQGLKLLLERHARILAGHRPDLIISELARRLARHRETLERHADSRLNEAKSTLARNAAVLRALNPSAALARGYTITMDKNGRILRSATEAISANELTTRFHDGEVKSEVRKA
ncbi:MAG: exodeoxyribonuclease VII large subunit [bacterium]